MTLASRLLAGALAFCALSLLAPLAAAGPLDEPICLPTNRERHVTVPGFRVPEDHTPGVRIPGGSVTIPGFHLGSVGMGPSTVSWQEIRVERHPIGGWGWEEKTYTVPAVYFCIPY